MVPRIGRFLLTIAALLSLVTLAAINSQAQSMSTHHVREVVRTGAAKPIGQLPPDQAMTLDVVLPLRDPAGLNSFLKSLYDPSSPSYRQFLTVPEFTARFGPTEADYDAVVASRSPTASTVTGGTRDGMDVQIKGPVSAVEAAFHVSMRTYQHPTERSHLLRSRPRAHHRPALRALARLRPRQLLHPASHARQKK